MRLALLLIVGGSVIAQAPTPAKILTFSPTFKAVYIDRAHCYFVFNPPNVQQACWDQAQKLGHNSIDNITVNNVDLVVTLPTGSISFQFKPNAADPSRVDYQISGQATTDAKPVLEIGTI